jgi:hypothetical protein
MIYLKTVPEGWVSNPKWLYIPTSIVDITQPGWISKTLMRNPAKAFAIPPCFAFPVLRLRINGSGVTRLFVLSHFNHLYIS